MAKLILKILYFAIMAVIGVFVGIIFYQSNVYQEVYNVTQEWLTSANYTNIARTYCGYFDSTALYKDEDSIAKMVVYAGTQEEAYYYYSLNDGAQEGSSRDSDYTEHLHHNFDYCYNFIIYIPESNLSQLSIGNISNYGTYLNNFGLRLFDMDDTTKYYDYKFEISSTVNPSEYQSRPLSEKDAALHSTRNLISSFYSSWGFLRCYLTEYTIKTIEEEMKINIGSFNVVDNNGKNIYEKNVNLDMDFSQDFFQNIQPLHDAYEKYLLVYNDYNYLSKSNYTKDEYEKAGTEFSDEIKKWEEESKNYPTYLTAFLESDVVNKTAPIWKTIGIEALFLLAVAILYIILFEFKRVKALVFKDRSNHQRYVPNKLPKDYNKNNKDKN